MAKVFMTDAKISPLISLRVTVFPIAAARQFLRWQLRFSWFEKISGVIPVDLPTLWTPRKRDRKLPRRQNPPYTVALTVFPLYLK